MATRLEPEEDLSDPEDPVEDRSLFLPDRPASDLTTRHHDIRSPLEITSPFRGHMQRLFVGLCVMGTLAGLVAAVLMFVVVGGTQRTTSDDHLQRARLLSEPIVVPMRSHFEWTQNVSRELFNLTGDLLIQRVEFALVDLHARHIPLQHVYNHHTFLSTLQGNTVALFGADGARDPITYGENSEGFFISRDTSLGLWGEFIDVYGQLASINQTVFVQLDITFLRVSNATDIARFQANPIRFDLFGPTVNNDGSLPIPGSALPGATCISGNHVHEGARDFNIYSLWGHLHIGAINETLIDATSGAVLAFAEPVYDDTGFLVQMNTSYDSKGITLKKGSIYTTIGCYENRPEGYGAIMVVWVFFGREESMAPESENKIE